VSVTDLADDVYFAKVGMVNAQDEVLSIDSRPSDAIALAVRFEAPIYVEESILDQASITLPAEQDDRLEVYRDFVNQLFEGGMDLEEGSGGQTHNMSDQSAGQERMLKQLISTFRCHVCRQSFEHERVRVAARTSPYGW
jgi:bifunctional DNase/RNase